MIPYKKFLLGLGITAVFGISSASAQIFVTIRPAHAVVVRTAQPSPRHIWVDEEWVERGGRYEWSGGHWENPRNGYVYRPGRWRHEGRGDSWQGGRWVNSAGPRHFKGHGNGHHDNGNHGNGNRGHGRD